MDLKLVTYEEARLAFFREQLAHAERVLKWWASNSENWISVEDKADAVSFYRDVVEILEGWYGQASEEQNAAN